MRCSSLLDYTPLSPCSSTNQWQWRCNCSLLAISPLDRRLGSRQTNYVGTVATCVESSNIFMAKSGQCADKLITFFHPFLIKMATKHIFTIFNFWHVPNFWEFNFWQWITLSALQCHRFDVEMFNPVASLDKIHPYHYLQFSKLEL